MHNAPLDPAGKTTRELNTPLQPQPDAAADAIPGAFAADPRVAHPADADRLDLLRLWNLVLRYRWLVAATVLAAMLGAVALTLLQPRVYRATATLQIDREAVKIVNFDGATQPVESMVGSDEFYQTQYELLRSRALAERVAADMGVAPATGAVAKGGTPVTVDALMAGLRIEPVRNSRLVKVSFDHTDPRHAAAVSNAFVKAFITSNLERRFDSSSYAKEFLEERLAQVKDRLEDSERELVDFAQQQQIVSGTEGQTLSGQTLTELNASLAQATALRARAEARWRQASSSGALPQDMLEGSIVRTLQARKAELQAEYQENLRVYKPAYPLMEQIQSQIVELDRQIAREMAAVRASIRAEYEAAAGQHRLLASQIARARGDELDLQGRSIRYNILKREVDTNRELYDGLLQRYKEVGVAGGVNTNNMSMVDRAQVPAVPFKPSMRRNLVTGLMLGLALGLLLAFVLGSLDDTVRTSDELAQFGLPLLGAVPVLNHGDPAQAASDPRSAFSEAYRSVRTALQFSTDTGVPRALLVTSAMPAEAKSTSASMLARNFAQLGRRVLLIDADLRNPTLHRQFGVSAAHGLSSYLAGAASLEQVVTSTGEERLELVSAGPLPPNPAELLSSPRMAALLREMEGRFDHVVIDGPPIMGLADAPILANLVDGTLLMVASGKTRRAALRGALRRLDMARARVLGAVLTLHKPARHGDESYYGEYAYYGAEPGAASRR